MFGDDDDTPESEADDTLEAGPDEGTPSDENHSQDAGIGSTENQTADGTASAATQNGQGASVNWEERYKNLQAAFTKTSQQLAEIRKAGPAAVGGASQEVSAGPEGFSEEKFDEIADKQGRGAALKYMAQAVKAEAKAETFNEMNQRAQAQKLETEARSLIDEFGYSGNNEALSSLQELAQREAQRGFNLSPGAALVLLEAGGDAREAIRLIRAGRGQAQANGNQPPKPPKVPGSASGSGRRAPENTGSRKKEYTLREIGF